MAYVRKRFVSDISLKIQFNLYNTINFKSAALMTSLCFRIVDVIKLTMPYQMATLDTHMPLSYLASIF